MHHVPELSALARTSASAFCRCLGGEQAIGAAGADERVQAVVAEASHAARAHAE